MAKKWSEVIANEEYVSLPASERSKVQAEYFDNVVAPHIPENLRQVERMTFNDYVSGLEADVEKNRPEVLRNKLVAEYEAENPLVVEQPVEVQTTEQEADAPIGFMERMWGNAPRLGKEGVADLPATPFSDYNKQSQIDDAEQRHVVARETAVREALPFYDEASAKIKANPEKYTGQSVLKVASDLARTERVGQAAETAVIAATLGAGAAATGTARALLNPTTVRGLATLGAVEGAAEELAGQGARMAVSGDTGYFKPIEIAKSAGFGGAIGGTLGIGFRVADGVANFRSNLARSVDDRTVDAVNQMNRMDDLRIQREGGAELRNADERAAAKISELESKAASEGRTIDDYADEVRAIRNERDATKDRIKAEWKAADEGNRGFSITAEQAMPDNYLVKRLAEIRSSAPLGSTFSRSIAKVADQPAQMERAAEGIIGFADEQAMSSINKLRSDTKAGGLADMFDEVRSPSAGKPIPESKTADEFLADFTALTEDSAKKVAQDLYNTNMSKLQQAIDDLPYEVSSIKPVTARAEAAKVLDMSKSDLFFNYGDAGNHVAKAASEIRNLRPKNFNDLDQMKRKFNERSREYYTKGESSVGKFYSDMANAVKSDAQMFADKIGADVGNIYKDADSAYRTFSEIAGTKSNKRIRNKQFDEQKISEFMKPNTGPEQTTLSLDQMRKAGREDMIPSFQHSIRSRVFNDAYAKAVGDRTATFNAGAFSKELRKKRDIVKAAFEGDTKVMDDYDAIIDSFNILRNADISRQMPGDIKRLSGGLTGTLSTVGGVVTGNFMVPVLHAVAGKLADMGIDAMSKFIVRNADKMKALKEARTDVEKYVAAEDVVKALLVFRDDAQDEIMSE